MGTEQALFWHVGNTAANEITGLEELDSSKQREISTSGDDDGARRREAKGDERMETARRGEGACMGSCRSGRTPPWIPFAAFCEQ